jgi:hypothetical protein
MLGVEGGEFVRHLSVLYGFNPLLGEVFGKPDATIATLQAGTFLDRQHDEFVTAVLGSDRYRFAACPIHQRAKTRCCSAASCGPFPCELRYFTAMSAPNRAQIQLLDRLRRAQARGTASRALRDI